MWADSVLATILHIEDSPASVKVSQPHLHHDHSHSSGAAMDEDAPADAESHAPSKPPTRVTSLDGAALGGASFAVTADTFTDRLCTFLGDHFGRSTIEEDGTAVRVCVDSTEAILRLTRPDGAGLPSVAVESADTYLQQSVTRACERFRRMAEAHVVL
jgi:hypothetical protein